MKKIALFLSVFLIFATTNAQQQVATLVHNDTTTAYYGTDALVNAHNAAVEGDYIYLSSGEFNFVSITKAITLLGAGWKGHQRTIVKGAGIAITSGSQSLYVEGIDFTQYFTMQKVTYKTQISKCRFKRVDLFASNEFCCFINCYIGELKSNKYVFTSSSGDHYSTYTSEYRNTHFVNCAVNIESDVTSSQSYMWVYRVSFQNCVLIRPSSSLTVANHYNKYKNCIFVGDTTIGLQEVYCSYSIGNSSSLFSQVIGTENKVYSSLSSVFKHPIVLNSSGWIDFNDSTSFELTDSAKTLYVDENGTQIGIYGGIAPFTDRVSYPLIKRIHVGNKTTSEGKLNVDIEVVSE